MSAHPDHHPAPESATATSEPRGAGAMHTPGPWGVTKAPVSGQLCVMAETAWICGQLSNGNGERPGEGDANARLIAAAPDLLSALDAMVALWNGVDDDDLTEEPLAALKQARTALASARPTP